MKKIMIVLGLFSMAGTALAAESTTYTFDDWQVTCQQTKDDGNHCAMFQRGMERKTGRLIYQVAVSFPKGKTQPQLDVLVPLGVSLATGVTIIADKNADFSFTLPYGYCIASGCMAEMQMNQKAQNIFHSRFKAAIHIQSQNGKKLVLPISLNGYSKAFSKLDANK